MTATLPGAARCLLWPVVWALSVLGAGAQDRDETWLLETAEKALFHLHVDGSTTTGQREDRWGKAFAIGPDLLMTSQHVLGDSSEWAPAKNINPAVNRAARLLDRNVTLFQSDDPPRAFNKAITLPTGSLALDAATLTLPDLALDAFFQLSLCEIVKGNPYTALMTAADDPTDPNSINEIVPVFLTAKGYDLAKFGGLYVFQAETPPGFVPEDWGHDGAPIFDASFNVVALVSAVTVSGGQTRVLATPIQPLPPGATLMLTGEPGAIQRTGPTPKCSMADLVRRINSQVSSQAIWAVEPEMKDGARTGGILFSYENVADTPNITSIRVDFQFWGEQVGGESMTRIALTNRGPDFDVLEETIERRPRTFRTSEIFRVGKHYETEIAADGGVIYFVRLTFTPTYRDTGITGVKIEREIQWSALKP